MIFPGDIFVDENTQCFCLFYTWNFFESQLKFRDPLVYELPYT